MGGAWVWLLSSEAIVIFPGAKIRPFKLLDFLYSQKMC